MRLLEARLASLQALAASLGAGRTHLRIEKGFERLRSVKKPANPCTRNPVLAEARLDPCRAGDLQEKGRKLVIPIRLRTPAFATTVCFRSRAATRQA